ncbi:unnamed protein product [Allacma fusca]|uniref:Uncharacterized protein n=1 Tax=Allacma fusca TaxID=39272 RepID=A0A8J2L5C2_9HEXA|nr:unnamed protein product [Allacma fusca]
MAPPSPIKVDKLTYVHSPSRSEHTLCGTNTLFISPRSVPTDGPIDPSIVAGQQYPNPGGRTGIPVTTSKSTSDSSHILRGAPKVGSAFVKNAPQSIAETTPPEVNPFTSASPISKRAVVKGSHEHFPKALYNPLTSKMVPKSSGASIPSTGSRKSKRSSIPELELNPILARPAAKAVAHRNYNGSPQAADVRSPEVRRSGRQRTKTDLFQSPDILKK